MVSRGALLKIKKKKNKAHKVPYMLIGNSYKMHK